jgi:hypothetical protein
MSKSPNQVGTSTTTSSNSIPGYVTDAQKGLLEAGINLTSPFIQQPPAFAVAGFTPPQELAFDLANWQAMQAYTNPGLKISDFGSSMVTPASVGGAAMSTPAQSAAAFYDPANVKLMEAAVPRDAALADIVTPDPATLGKAEQLGYADISKFFNPYQKDVIDTTVRSLDDENQRSLAAIRARQAAEGSYGGNRGALQESEQYRNYGNTIAQTIAALNQSGWNNAANLGMGNTQLRQQTGLANQAAQNQMKVLKAQLAQQTGLANQGALNQVAALAAQLQQQAGLSNQAALNLASTLNAQFQQQTNLANAQLAQQSGLANQAATNQTAQQNAAWQQQASMFNAQQPAQLAQLQNQLDQTPWQQQLQALQLLLGTGGQQQQLAQQSLNVPFDMLNRLSALVPNVTGNTTSSTSTPIYGPSTMQSILPLLSLGAGLLGGSDRSLKTDIQKLGKDKKTGLDMYAYRYKGDPKNTMKNVGPMAQDVEKKYPGSTQRVAGKLAIKPAARAMLGV